jgi:hypothetical protein
MPPSSAFERLQPHILQNVAYQAAAATFLGPPKELLPLLSLSRSVHAVLDFKENTPLYADIFRFKFDFQAPQRRLSGRWLTSRCLAFELRKRFGVLKRIRFNAPHRLDDLWTAYLLMSESDGRNESQLIEWARVEPYLYNVMIHRLRAPADSPISWLGEMEGTSLTVWLLWMTTSQGAFCVTSLFPFSNPCILCQLGLYGKAYSGNCTWKQSCISSL